MMRVFVISAVTLQREGLCEIVGRRATVECVGAAADAGEAAVAIERLEGLPDVVLFDVGSPGKVDEMKELISVLPDVRVVAICVPSDAGAAVACAEAGACAFLTTDSSIGALFASLESVARGDLLCSPSVAGALVRRVATLARGGRSSTERRVLTTRELEILQLLDEGLSNKQIAQRLGIELSTVKNHVHRILEKLGVNRRGEAAARARTYVLRLRQSE
jgi:DNA-binding NarL/FixJ family response regulator